MTILQDSLLNPFSKVQALRLGKFKFKVKLLDNPNRFLDETDNVVLFRLYERVEGDTSGTLLKTYRFDNGVYDDLNDNDDKSPLGSFNSEDKTWSIKVPSFFEKSEGHEGFTVECFQPELARKASHYPFNYVVPAGFEHSQFARPETVVKKKPLLDWEIPLWTPNNNGDLVTVEDRGAATEGLAAGPLIATEFFRDNAVDSAFDSSLGSFSIADFLWSVPAKVSYREGPTASNRQQLAIDEGQTISGAVAYARDGWVPGTRPCGVLKTKVLFDSGTSDNPANFTITTWAGGMVAGQQIIPSKFDRGDDTIWVRIEHDAPLSKQLEGCDENGDPTVVTAYVDFMQLGSWAINTVLNEGS